MPIPASPSASSGASSGARALSAQQLADLFQRHGEPLAGMVKAVAGPPAEPAEVLQDAFVKAWQWLSRGHRPDDPKAWIFAVTLNQARDRRRADRRRAQRRRSAAAGELADDEPPGATPEPLAHLIRVETLAATEAAIAALDDGEKEVFLLRVAGELTFRATAAALGIPEGTAKTRMRAALARLRRDLRWFAPDATASAHHPEADARRRNES